jgi:hypothetical protein
MWPVGRNGKPHIPARMIALRRGRPRQSHSKDNMRLNTIKQQGRSYFRRLLFLNPGFKSLGSALYMLTPQLRSRQYQVSPMGVQRYNKNYFSPPHCSPLQQAFASNLFWILQFFLRIVFSTIGISFLAFANNSSPI